MPQESLCFFKYLLFFSPSADPGSPAHLEESSLVAKEHPAVELLPIEPELTGAAVEAAPSTQATESSPVSPQAALLKAHSPDVGEESEPSEEPMDTGAGGLVPSSPGGKEVHSSQEEEVAAPTRELRERFSPQPSEEEAPEGHAPMGPEPNETPLRFASESKHSPSPPATELLVSMSTPMEAYSAANPLDAEEEAGPAPPPLRSHPLVKSDIVNEISNLSQGDASASSFPGSELPFASPYHEGGGSFSMEMAGLTSTDVSLQKEDGASLPLGETDDSLIFDVKGDGEKGRRRSSPARSRVKQVTLFADSGWYSLAPYSSWRTPGLRLGESSRGRKMCARSAILFSLYFSFLTIGSQQQFSWEETASGRGSRVSRAGPITVEIHHFFY